MSAFNEMKDVKEKIIAENEHAYAFPSNIPIVPGHLCIVPKRPVEKMKDLSREEIIALFSLMEKLKPALKKIFGATGFNHAWNEGRDAGQNIDQLHIHLLPRKKGDEGITEYEPRKFLYRPGSREKSPQAELILIANKIRKEL